jgi:hypothetical protein
LLVLFLENCFVPVHFSRKLHLLPAISVHLLALHLLLEQLVEGLHSLVVKQVELNLNEGHNLLGRPKCVFHF